IPIIDERGKFFGYRGADTNITERKKAEKALQINEERLRAITENSSDNIVLVGPDLKIQFINKTSSDLKKEDIIGKSINAFTPKDFQKLATEKYQSVFKTGKPTNYQSEYLTAKGETHYYDVRLSPIVMKGKVISIVSNSNNVTEHRKAEKTLQVSEEKFRGVFNSMTDVFTRTDLEGNCLLISPSVFDVVGYQPDEFIDRNYSEFFTDPEDWRVLNKKILETGGVNNYESEVNIKDGSKIIISFNAKIYYDNAGNPAGIQSVFRDVTEQKRAEVALKENEQRLSGIINSISDNMSIMDKDLNIVWANEVGKELFGSDILGQKCHLCYHNNKEACEPCLVKKTFQDGLIHDHFTKVLDKEGNTREFWCTSNVAAYDELGKPRLVIEVSRDVTEQKQAEEILRESEERLNAVLSSFPSLIMVLDDKGRYLDIFTATPELLIAPKDQLLNRTIHEVMPLEKAQVFQDIIDKTLSTGESQKIEYPLVIGGIKHWLYGQATKFKFQSADCVLCLVHDITKRKKAEEALQETHDYLDKLINYANAPIIVWDPKFRVTMFNRAFERLTGYTSDEVIGQDLNMLFPQASRKESLNKIERTLSGQYWESVDIPILCKNGQKRLALWNSANIYAEDGITLLSTIAQGIDIT
ncbi:PAS domain S-box protein, partial [bacterium]|nr:PAS domain S-box protein [bacterium]